VYLRKYADVEGIILNPHVFDVDYVPDVLPFREGQLDEIAREVAYFVKRGLRTNLFLYGPPGTGKTASMRKILSEAQAVFPSVRTAYVNVWKYRTRAGILGEIARQLGIAVPLRGVSADHIMEFLEDFAERNKCLVVLDEADRLAGQYDVLYDLSRLGRKALLVTIANSREFLSTLDPRITSTLFQSSIEFPPYNVPQLTEILRQRAELGLKPGSYDEKILRACAAVGFSRGGDARVAIVCLANAAKEAEQRGRERIILDDVKRARDSMTLHRELDPKLRLIIEILSEFGPLTTSELYRRYSEKVPITERTLRNYINELQALGLIEVFRARRRGNVRIVKLKD